MLDTLTTATSRRQSRLHTFDGHIVVSAGFVLALALVYWRTISTYRAPYRILADLPIPVWIEQLYAWRWIVRGAMLAAGVTLAALELRFQSLSRRLKPVLSQPRWATALVVLVAVVGRSYLLVPGRIALGDGLSNVANAVAIRVAAELGNPPPFFWSNFAYMGFPWLQFHNSAFYYQGAVLDLLLHDPFLSSKLALLANHILAALAMFFYVRYLTRSAWAGLVSATAWATTFFHYHFFIGVGSVHLSTLIPSMPAALLCVEAILDRRRQRPAVAGLALAVSLQLWAHAFYGAVSTALLLLYALTRLLLPNIRQVALSQRISRLGMILIGIGLGATAAISQWLPPYVERNLVGGWNPGTQFPHPIIGWRQVLTFREGYLFSQWGGYVGLSVFGLAMLGVVLTLSNRDRRMSGLIIWLAATAYLSLGPRYLPFDAVFSRIPFGQFVYAIRSPGKYLLFMEFSLAALTGVALKEVLLSLYKWRRKPGGLPQPLFLAGRRLALLMIAAIAGEMIFLSLQVNSLYPETWVGVEPGRKEYLDWLRANGDRTSRVLADPLGDLEVPALGGQPSFASHNEETPPSAGLYFEVSQAVRDDAKAHTLRPATRDLLYLLDVGYVALREPAPPDSGWLSGYDGEPYKIWRSAEHSPAVAARSLKPSADAADTSALIRNMHLNRPAKTAATIPVKASTAVPESESTGEQDPTPLGFIIKQYQVRLTAVTFDYQISAPAYLQLGYSAYPYLDVYLDGRPHESFSTALNLIGLATPAGEHRIELRPRLSPLRVIAYRLDVIGLVAIVVIAGWRRIFARFIPKRKA